MKWWQLLIGGVAIYAFYRAFMYKTRKDIDDFPIRMKVKYMSQEDIDRKYGVGGDSEDE